jgi:hypothetical protein
MRHLRRGIYEIVLESIYPASQARRLSALDGAHVNADINDHTENFAIA